MPTNDEIKAFLGKELMEKESSIVENINNTPFMNVRDESSDIEFKKAVKKAMEKYSQTLKNLANR